MNIAEYGQENREVIMLLHGGGLSRWSFRAEAERLSARYRVVLPVLDGHADSGRPFTTIEANAEALISHIDADLGGTVSAIGGLSLGAQVLVEMLSRRRDICRFALIESALAVPMPLTRALTGPALGMSYGLIKREWFSRLQFKALNMPPAMFADYCRDTRLIAKSDMTAFLRANAGYAIKPSLSDTEAAALILVGGRESGKMRRSAAMLQAAIPGSELRVLGGYTHGEISLSHPDEYVALLERLMASSK